MTRYQKFLLNRRQAVEKNNQREIEYQKRYMELLQQQYDQAKKELEARIAAEPSRFEPKLKETSKQEEGPRVAESSATKKSHTPKKAQEPKKTLVQSWEDTMKKYGIDVDKNRKAPEEVVEDMLNRFNENFVPDASSTKIPFKIPETRMQQKAAVEQLVEQHTKDIDQQIDETRNRLTAEEYARRGITPEDIATNEFAALQAAEVKQVVEDSSEMRKLLQQRNAVEQSVRRSSDPDYIGIDWFEGLSAPYLSDAAARHKQALDRFHVVDYAYKNNKATAESRQNAANAEFATRNELDKLVQKYLSLSRYIQSVGLPDQFDKLPSNIQDVLKELVPDIDAQPDNLKLFKEQAKEYAAQNRKKNALNAATVAKEGSISFDEKQIERMLNEINTMMEVDKALSGADKYNGLSTINQFGRPSLRNDDDIIAQNFDPQYKNYQEALRILVKAKRYRELGNKVQATNTFWDGGLFDGYGNVKNMGYAIKNWAIETLEDPVGLVELSSTLNQLDLRNKLQSGEALTYGERTYMDALSLNQIVHDKYRDLEDVNAYKYASIAANSVKFMAEMYAGNAALKAISKAGTKQVGKQVTKNIFAKTADFMSGDLGKNMMKRAAYQGMEALGQEGVKKGVLNSAKIIAKKLANRAPGAVVRVLGDATQALALSGTILLPRTLSDINNLRLGMMGYTVDDNGLVKATDYHDGLGLGEAVYTGVARSFTENFSEMLGEYGLMSSLFGKPLKWIEKGAVKRFPSLGKLAEKFSSGGQWLKNNFGTKGYIDALRAGEWHGVFGETAEEYYGMALQHWLGVSDSKLSLWDDITSKQNFLDIFGGIALSTAFLGTFGVAGNLHAQHKYNATKREAKAHFGDKWDAIEQAMVLANQSSLPSVVNSLVSVYNQKDQVDHILRFYDALERYRGSSYAALSMYENNTKNAHKQALEESRRTGYSTGSIQLRDDLDRALEIAQSAVNDAFGIQNPTVIMDAIEEEGGVENFFNNRPMLGVDKKNAIYTWQYIKEAKEGALQRLQDDIQEDVDRTRRNVEKLSFDTPTGKKIVSVTYKDADGTEHEGYVVGGDFKLGMSEEVAKDEDGNPTYRTQHDASGDITIRDTNGRASVISADNIVEVNGVANTSDVIADQTMRTQLTAMVQHGLREKSVQTSRGIKFGEKYELNNGDVMTIVSSASDGGVLYTIKDKQTGEETMHHADSQQSMNLIIEDAQGDRANQIYSKMSMLAELTIDQDSKAQLQEEAEDQIDPELQARIEESAKPVTAHIDTAIGSKWSKRKALKTWTNIKQAINKLKKADSFDEFKALLEKAKLPVGFRYEGRLKALYNALKNGNITSAQFAAVFIPEEFRSTVLSKSQLDAFLALEIDADGNVTSMVETKALVAEKQSKVDISSQPEYLIPEDEDKKNVDISKSPEYLIPEDADPAPKSDTAGAAAANNEQNTPALQQALNKLTTKMANDVQTVIRNWTTGTHYFLRENGRIVLYSRVHTVLDDQYEPVYQREQQLQEEINRLRDLYNNDRDAFDKILDDNNLEGYKEYLKQSGLDIYELDDALFGIANELVQRDVHVSVKYGSLIDEICRKFFGDEALDYNDYKEMTSQETFDDIVRQMSQLKQYFDNLGWRLVSSPVVVHSELYDSTVNLTVRVAGETDMIAIDKEGNYHILDFKTSYKNFSPQIFNQLPARLSDGRRPRRSTRDQYSMQLSTYQIMLEDNLSGHVESLLIIPWTLRYDSGKEFIDLEGAKNEISGNPYIIPLSASSNILGRFSVVDDTLIYELQEQLFKQYDFVQQQVQLCSELIGQSKDLIDGEVELSTDQLGAIMAAYDTIKEQADQSKSITDLQSALHNGESVLSTIEQIKEILSRKSQEQSVAEASRKAAEAAEQNKRRPVANDEAEWRLKTVTHARSAAGFIGIEDAVAIDNPNLKLKAVTGNSDFITNAEFAFVMINGRAHVLITYGGHTYQPVSISTAHDSRKKEGAAFYNAINRLFKTLPKGSKIVSTGRVSRTNGEIIQAEWGTLMDKGLVSTTKDGHGVYLYDVQFAAGDTTFGLIVEEGGEFKVTIPGYTQQSRDTVKRYDPSNGSRPAAGTVVMMIRRPYDELPPERQPRVPVNMYNTKFSQGDVDLIVGILSGDYCRDKSVSRAGILNQAFYEDGVDKGLSNEQVLNLLIAYGSYNRKSRPHVHIELDQHNGNIIKIVGNVEGDPEDQIASRSFDFSTAEGKEAFKQFLLANVHRNLDQSFMASRLGNITNNKSLVYGLKEFFTSKAGQKLVSEKGAIKFGQSSLIFDAKDFKDESNPADTQGLSGLGWYVRHGFLRSNFGGFDNTLLEFDDTAPLEVVTEAQLKPKSVEQAAVHLVLQAIENGVEEADPLDIVLSDQTSDNFGLVLKAVPKKEATGTIDIKAAEEELRRMLGDGFDIKTFEGFIKQFENGIVAVGACINDAILLSKQAAAGTEYHEAFHRVTEVIFTDKQRQRVFRMYRNAKKLKNLTDHQVSEAMADDFMYYKQNRPTFKLSWRIFKSIADYIKGINKVGGFRLFWLYRNVYNGKYANRKASSSAALKQGEVRWKLVKRGADFNEIATQHQYKVLINSIAGILLNPATQTIKWDGSNIETLKIDKEILTNSPAFKYIMTATKKVKKADGSVEEIPVIPESTKLAIRELLDNWESVEPDVATYFSTFATDFKVRYEDYNDATREGSASDVPVIDNTGDTDEDDDFDEEIASASNEEHMKASYEFSQFSRTSQKVKFFFSGIIKSTWVKNDKGELEKTPIVNEYGLPELLDPKYVFSEVLSEMHDCTSVAEFIDSLNTRGQANPMFDTLYQRLTDLYKLAYGQEGKVDYDAEQVIVQIFSTIRAQKHNFEIVRSSKSSLGGQKLQVFQSDAGHSARNYTTDWSSQFAAGASMYVTQDENGQYKMKGYFKPSIFDLFFNRFFGNSGMSYAYSTEGKEAFDNPKSPKFIINGKAIDVTQAGDVEVCKRMITKSLRTLGIIFEKDVFDYMLIHTYGNAGADGLTKFLQDRSDKSFFSFCKFIKGFAANGKLNLSEVDGKTLLNGVKIDQLFNNSGFVKELANWKYAYRTAHDQLSVLAVNNNKYYVISQNNIMSDRLSELENGGDERDKLFSTPYVLWYPEEGSKSVGSLIAKHVLTEGHSPLKMATLSGFRTDAKDDLGIDYAQINRREDYIAKMTILQHRVKDPVTGQVSTPILFPTLSDKKTWCYIYGVTLPGIDFSRIAGLIKRVNGRPLPFIDSVVDQFIEYAMTEDQSIRRILDTQSQLSPEERIANFHNGAKVKDGLGATHTVIQGGRYNSLLGVYDAEGNFIEFNRTLDENGVYQDEEANYRRAHEFFFDPLEVDDNGELRYETAEEMHLRQREQVRRLLEKQMESELEYAAELGLIQRVNNDPNPMFRYKNVGLDCELINSIEQQLKQQIKNALARLNLNRDTNMQENQQCHAYAVYLVIADTMTRHMMSIQEVERIFAGNPSAFKFTYDKQGHLIDRTVDQQKRLGGLVSTGQNNVAVQGIPEEYTTAEVDNEMILSEDLDEFEKLIYTGLLDTAAVREYNKRNGITFENVDEYEDNDEVAALEAMDVEDLEKEVSKTTLEIVKKIAKAKTDSFRKSKEEHLKGIDVADGGSYITDKMAENLLRMAGSYNNEVARAFKVLRGEEVDGKVYTVKDTREVAKAFQLVLTTVIGTQKYTAYGFRYQYGMVDGESKIVSAVPYYNKTALFPLFKNICTGKMAKIYKKMLDDGVDMLMVNSSVKVGSEGSKEINWDAKTDFNDPNGFHFHSYKQKYAYLRKQFNTDPKEKELMSMGTLMTKIVLSTLIPNREYDVNGQKMSGTQLRDDIMRQLKTLSYEGVKEIKEMFFGEDGLFDVEKFSKTLTKELQGRGASAEMLDAVSVVERNGVRELKVPLAALSGMNWIQSIIKSMVDKRVVDTNTPGKAFYQRSVWNMEGPTTVLGDEDLPPSINNGNRLLPKNEEGSMDCVLSIDYFEDVLKEAKIRTGRKVKKTVKKTREVPTIVEKNGVRTEDYAHRKTETYEEEIEVDETVSVSTLSFEQQKQWLIDHGIISGMKNGEWVNASASIIGYRIPTQAISSIHALRVVDVLPTVRDTVILPAEFTKITGSDFDIDKVFLSTLFRKANGSINFTDDVQKQAANKLVQDYIAILKDSKRSFAELNGSIDNDTELVKEVVKDIFGESTETLLSYSAYTMRSQFSSKDEFINGKRGIGPYALNNNNHILTMLYDVSFADKKNGILTRLGLTSLHEANDKNGNSIMSWLSAMINAHVDVAKDPYISKLNVNPYTYNLVSLLLRIGYGKDTFYFTSQPIMRQLAEAYANATGKYMVEQNGNRFQAIEDAENNVIINLINSTIGTNIQKVDLCIETWAHGILDKYGNAVSNINVLIDALLKNNTDVLRNIAKLQVDDIAKDTHKHIVTVNGSDIELSTADVLILVSIANTQFAPYATALSELVKYSKIDTKKEGKNIVEQTKFMEGYDGMFSSKNPSGSRLMFDTKSLDRMRDGSYIGVKTENATLLFTSILGEQLIESTRTFGLNLARVFSYSGSLSSDNLKALKSVTGQIMAKLKAGFFFGPNGYATKLGIDATKLVSGDNTIYDRLLKIKADLANNPAYSDMIDADGNPLNYLLRNLVSGDKYEYQAPKSPIYGTVADTYENAKFVKPLSFMNDESVNADELSQAWEDLLKDTAHPELQKFAQDLIVYAFITSGDNGGRQDIFKFVPNSWKLGMMELGDSYETSYAKYMYDLLLDYKNGAGVFNSADVDDIILNNWHDNRYIPTVSLSTKEGVLFEQWATHPTSGYPIVLGGISKSGQPFDGSRFIKIRRQNKNSTVSGQREFVIYEHTFTGERNVIVGRDSKGKPMYKRVQYPIYTMVDPRGTKFSSVDIIVGYGQATAPESIQAALNNLARFTNALNRVNVSKGTNYSVEGSSVYEIIDKLAKYIASRQDQQVAIDFLRSNGIVDSNLLQFIQDVLRLNGRSNSSDVATTTTQSIVGVYSGNVIPEEGTVFVFGSNTEGRHGKGAAKVAHDMFGAQYGVSEGMTGNAYALPTKDLAKGLRSLSKEQIINNIKHLYETAVANPNLKFKVAYRNGANEETLNGYTGAEMIEMFKKAGDIPANVYFSQEWVNIGLFDLKLTKEEQLPQNNAAEGTYPVPQQSIDTVNNPSEFTMQPGGATVKQLSQAELALGRKIITPSNRQYITEKVEVRIGDKIYSQKEFEQFLSIQNQIVDILFDNSVIGPIFENYTDISYAEWKRLLNSGGNNALEVFVKNKLEDALDDGDWINTNDENFEKYDKNTKTIKIPSVEYKIVSVLSQNPEYIEFLKQISPGSYAEDIITIERDKYRDVGEMVAQFASNLFESGFKSEIDADDLQETLNSNNIHILYNYTDSRQLTLWNNSDEFSDEEMKHCK